jgi:hypothetical protein
MSEPSPSSDSSLTPPEPAAGGQPDAAGVLSALSDALSSVADGLKGEPVLLTGFGAMLLVEVAGVLRGGTFLVVVSLMLAAYLISLVAYLVFRRRGQGRPNNGTSVKVIGSKNVDVSDHGGEGPLTLLFKRSVGITFLRDWWGGRGPTPPPEPPSEREPGAPSEPEPEPEQENPQPPARRERYTPSLARHRDTVLNAARSSGGRNGARFEVVADSGCGKTLLLEEVSAGLKDDGRLVLFVTAAAPQYGTGRAMGTTERQMADYAACRHVIDAIAADVHRAYDPQDGEPRLLEREFGRRLESDILGVRDGRPEMRSDHSRVRIVARRSSDVQAHVHIGDAVAGEPAGGTAASRLAEMQRQLTQVLDRVCRERPTALIVDDVHAVSGTPVEEWLLAVLRGLSAAVVVHALRPPVETDPAAGVQRVKLGLLPEQETTEYVRDHLTDIGWHTATAVACAAEIATLTQGHPIGVATCTTIVRDSLPPDASTGEVRSLLLGGAGHWDDDGAFEAVRRYVDDHAERTVGRPVPLFDLLVVLRRCTAKILVAVLGESEGVTERQASRLYDWLSGCAFVTPFDDDVSEGWRLHDYLRENLDRRFRLTRSREHAACHAVAERYYRAGMTFDEELDEQSPHAAGARYEDPDWQRDSQEWLHHAAHLPREDFEGSKRAMIRLFFEAFFWWDTEVPSSYCDQLVAAYRVLPDDRDLRWVTWLDQLRTGYVPGRINQVPGRDRERWEQAGEALDAVAEYLRLRRGRVPADPDLRRIYIIFCQLQGDVVWFGGNETDADRHRAAAWFRASRDACTEDDELWIGNWGIWQEADLWTGADPALARDLVNGLEARLAAEEDHELPVWLAETFADIAWAEGDLRRAFDAHARAALHGFVYHVRQETYGQYPNRYSDSLYRSVLTHLDRREQQATDAGLTEEVTAAKVRSRALFAPYWGRIGEDPGDSFGLPHPPGADELGTGLTDFARTAKWVIRYMADELEKSVEEPLRDPAAP